MTVTVVGQDESKKKRATCKRCGAQLEFYEVDVETHSYTSMGESDTASYVECPQCKNKVWVK